MLIDAKPATLNLGYQGEYGIKTLVFDCGAWFDLFPTGVLAVSFTSPLGVFGILPTTQWVRSENILTVNVMANMTHDSGIGSLNIRLLVGADVQKRSALFETFVKESHSVGTDPMPDVMQEWVDAATLKLAEVDAAIEDSLASTRYQHIRYADSITPADEDMSEVIGEFIGICVTNEPNAPTTAISYTWNQIKGIQGIQGATGPTGPKGGKGDTGESAVHVGVDAPTAPDILVWVDTDEAYELDTQKWAAVDIVATQLPAGSLPTASISQNETGTHIQVDIPTITNDDIAAMETSLESYCQTYIDTAILGGSS